MDEIELIDGVLTKTGDIIARVPAGSEQQPTPCGEWDVAALRDHIVGWVQVFEAGCHDRSCGVDPAAYRAGDDAAEVFRAAASSIVEGWATHGLHRKVRVSSGDAMPGEMVFNMTLMEYFGHGWDLATATAQPVPFSDTEAAEVLFRARATLPPEYRGPGMPFGDIVALDPGAPAVDRLVGFLGRRP
jgi:uncharacterized protein (TIGR03086 family)